LRLVRASLCASRERDDLGDVALEVLLEALRVPGELAAEPVPVAVADRSPGVAHHPVGAGLADPGCVEERVEAVAALVQRHARELRRLPGVLGVPADSPGNERLGVDLGLQPVKRSPSWGEKGVTSMRRVFVVGALVASVSLALMASSAASAPLVDRFHGTFSDTFPDNICGIDGTTVVSGMDNIQVFADGTFKDQFRQNAVFTSAATGKSVEIFVAQQFTGVGPIDNGDGTVTFVSTFKGLPEKINLPNGPVLSRDAGFVSFNDTFDATTGDFLGETISPENGPHPDLDSGFALFCDVIVPALS
jgi:hypothetical protein